MALEITDSNYEALVAEGKPMVMDFWATWCGPCQLIGPLIEDLAKEYEGRINIGKVNVDDSSDLAMQFGVRNIPTILFMKDGKVLKKLVGAQDMSTLKAEAEKLL